MFKYKEETVFPMKGQRMKSSAELCLGTEVVQLYGGIFNTLHMRGDGTDSPDTEEEISPLCLRNSISPASYCVCYSGIFYFSN